MARLISGGLLIAWGLAVVVSVFFRNIDAGTAFGAGQMVGWLLGFGLIALGVRAIAKSRAAQR